MGFSSITTGIPVSMAVLSTLGTLKANPFSIISIGGSLVIGAICAFTDFYRVKKNRNPSYSSYLIGIDKLCKNIIKQSYIRLEEFIND